MESARQTKNLVLKEADEISVINFNSQDEKTVNSESLKAIFDKLQTIKKQGSLNFFKKQVDVLEEDVLKLMLRFLELIPPKEFFKFLDENKLAIQVFFGISFNPFNRNKPLASLCMQVSIKMMAFLFEVYIDACQMRRDFSQHSTSNSSRLSSIKQLFDNSSCFLSLLFVSDLKHVSYKIKTEKLKVFQNLISRLGSSSSTGASGSGQATDPYVLFKNQISSSLQDDDESKLISVSNAWFDVIGEILDKSAKNSVNVNKTDVFGLEIETTIKYRNKVFQLLDHYFEMLLAMKEQEVGLMGLMEKNIARYISKVVDTSDTHGYSVDLDLFKLIFDLINKLFQRRKKMFGTAMNDDELDYYMSGGSSDHEEGLPFMSTLSRENDEEQVSFKYLQKMTGKLYLLLIDLLMMGPDSSSVTKYNIFSLFMNEEECVSYLEIFEPMYSQKLIKTVLMKLKTLVAKAVMDGELKKRLMHLFRLTKCTEKECSCFIDHMIKNIFFKLSIKCPIQIVKDLIDSFYEVLRNLLQIPEAIDQVSTCYLNMFSMLFTSLLRQNLDTIDKMTIQLMTTINEDHDGHGIGNILVADLRQTISHNVRRFNVFVDVIGIEGRQVKLSKEMCESILLILSDTHRVKEYLGNQQYKIDLGFDEYNYVTTQDVIEAVQQRWQVRLLAFRTQLMDLSAKMLKILFTRDKSIDIFKGFLAFFKKLNSQRGASTHSFYVGFLTYVFTKEFNLVNYSCENFVNFLIIFDIQLRGLGYYDRDCRIQLPIKVQKEFIENCLNYLKIKFEHQNPKLTIIQLVICYRFQDMFTRDPAIFKCLIPLMFDISASLLSTIDQIDLSAPCFTEGLKLLLEESYTNNKSSILIVQLKILTSVLTITAPFAAYSIILKPHILVSGRYVVAGGFSFLTFGDIKNYILSEDFIKNLISVIDKIGYGTGPQVELSKFLTIAACYKPEIIQSIFPQLLTFCLDNSVCSSEVFKIRMRLFMSFLTLDKNITSNILLSRFIDKSQDILFSLAVCEVKRSRTLRGPDVFQLHQQPKAEQGGGGSSRQVSQEAASSLNSSPTNSQTNSCSKKQWILALLMKMVFLSTVTELPIQKLREMISLIKQTRDEYLLENCLILESYLAAIKGLHKAGLKELRETSYFNESNVMSRKEMHLMMQMIDKFCRNESIEGEARLLQNNFDRSLFEFFSADIKALSPIQIFERLLSNIKSGQFKWTYLYDAKNIVLYSLAETDKQELCLIKRHISGKNSWFMKEDLNSMFIEKDKLEIIDPKVVRRMPYSPPAESNSLIKLLQHYRKEPDSFDYFASKPIDENVLAIIENQRVPERVSNFKNFPLYLKEYWDAPAVEPRLKKAYSSNDIAELLPREPLLKAQSSSTTQIQLPGNKNGDTSSQSNQDSQKQNSTSFTEKRQNKLSNKNNPNFEGKNKLLVDNLTDPCLRFIIEMEMFTLKGQGSDLISDFYLINPEGGEKAKMFMDSLSFIDKSPIVNSFKVGIVLAGANQEKECEILDNEFPSSGLFNTFVNNLGERISESVFSNSLGNDKILYHVGPLIPRKNKCSVEVKRIVGNVPSLIIWSQNSLNRNYESIKSKFNRDIIIIEELPNQLLRIRSLRKVEGGTLDSVFLPDSLLTLKSLLLLLPSYIYSSQMEINPLIFSALKQEYRSISPFLEARKKQLKKLIETNKEDTKQMTIDTLLELIFSNHR